MPIDELPKREFEHAVELYADSLYRVAFRLTGKSDLASELVQETCLQAWQGLDSLRDRSRLRAWMFGILRFQYSKLLRRESRYSELPGGIAEMIPDKAPPSKADVQEIVQTAIGKLDESYRLPILLVSMEGISVDEAAEILGLPRGTVLSRLHRGREKLKGLIERTAEFRPKHKHET